ncbi:proline-rich protein HaeIII subfamily 1-like [Kogia breviceps]|uniref:proline-rich protein HaeIII subfamily 1-like n=1 Tax=Kogia breviceps TaxID=27615 RepID=UPI0034D29FC6
MGGVYGGPRTAIGCQGGCGADPLAGRLRRSGAERPRKSYRERLRRGPGRAAGPLGGLGGSYLGLRRGGHRSPLLFGGSRLPTSAPGSGRRRQQRPRRPRVGGFREIGPSCLRVRASGRRASPALSERLRPAWAGTSPAAPAQRARVGPPPQPLSPPLAGAAGASSAASRQPRPTAAPSPSAPARAPPTPRTKPRPARLGCRRASARTYLPRPLPPAGAGPSVRPPPTPPPPPHVTPPESTACACADTPHFIRPRRPRPNFSSSPYGRAGNSALDFLFTREECRNVGVENPGFATVAFVFRPIESHLKAGWGGEARGR